jgi:cysteine desulfurase
MIIYLDHNATAPIRPEAEAAVLAALRIGGNPSSVHSAGRAARALVEEARLKVAALVGAPAPGVVFTSGGAEANGLAVASAVHAGSRRLIIGATEHSSVLASAEAAEAAVDVWPVDGDGVADLTWLEQRLAAWNRDDGRPFAALMLANNETGVIQPVAEAAALMQAAGGWLHVDAIQGFGKLPIDFRALGADTLAMSAHKIGGPQGVGALAFGARVQLARQIHGGGQERSMRAGTENVPGVAGFGAAAAAALRDLSKAADSSARDAAAARLVRDAGAVVMGAGAARLPGVLCIATAGFASELQLMQMDLAGVLISAGSACSSGKVKASHVLTAMGHDQLAACAVRVSGGWNTTPQDWEGFADAWLDAHARHAARRSQSAA